jgi:hypothetical protein
LHAPISIAAQYRLTLARLEPRIFLIDNVNATFAADNPAIFVTLLKRAERITNLHDTPFKTITGPMAVEGAELRQPQKACQPLKSS